MEIGIVALNRQLSGLQYLCVFQNVFFVQASLTMWNTKDARSSVAPVVRTRWGTYLKKKISRSCPFKVSFWLASPLGNWQKTVNAFYLVLLNGFLILKHLRKSPSVIVFSLIGQYLSMRISHWLPRNIAPLYLQAAFWTCLQVPRQLSTVERFLSSKSPL